MRTPSKHNWPRSVVVAAILVSTGAVFAMLYLAQAVLIPLALAALLTFMLTPVLDRVEGWGVPRIPAVALVAAILGLAIFGIGWTLGGQMTSLAVELPDYRENIKDKVADIRAMLRGGAIEKVQKTIEDINEELEKEEEAPDDDTTAQSEENAEETDEKPVPVQVRPDTSIFGSSEFFTPLLGTLATAGLVLVLLIFMLIKREDLISRIVSLAGVRNVAATTRAFDEAKQRIGRYLLAQFALNCCFGVVVGISMALVGLPYSALWGFCAAVFRYVPYVGPWVAAILPIGVSISHFPGWTTALIVIAIFVTLELILNNVLEPWLYGSSVGLSEVAVIVAAVTWTLLWGPIGLVLATPMTVCLVVLSRSIPALSIFDRLLSEQPALKPHVWLYQRLLARDDDNGRKIVQSHMQNHSLAAAADEVLVPTLALARREMRAERIEDSDQKAILETLRNVIDSLPEASADCDPNDAAAPSSSGKEIAVMGFPVRKADEPLLLVFERLLADRRCSFQVISSELLLSEQIALVEQRRPACVCVSALAPGELLATRQVVKRLRECHPDAKILVGRWSPQGVSKKSKERMREHGADRTVATLEEMREILIPTIQFHTQQGGRETQEDHPHSDVPRPKIASLAFNTSESG